MVAVNPNSICKRAQGHYYEYVRRRPRGRIPTKVLSHIDKCSFCQAAVNQLKIILAEADKPLTESTMQAISAMTTDLTPHFAYTEALVSCNTVKPFLPSLAIPALDVGVPPPITVHLDKCQRCADDLEAIRQLNLTDKQLGRLGQLFAEQPSVDADVCPKAQNAVSSVGAMAFESTSAETLRHLCICPDCRKLLYEDRAARSKKLSSNAGQSPVTCDAISAADIFDFVVPYGVEPRSDRYAMFRQSLKAHLVSCPKCLDRMQQLHNTVFSILERRESGIATCFKVRDSARESVVSTPDDMYKKWPIEVQVFDKPIETETVETTGSSIAPDVAVLRKPKQRLSVLSIRPFLKHAVAAAAAVLIVALLLNIPVAKAFDLGRIYKALEQIQNVCLTHFVPGKAEPTQQVWISQAVNIKMFKNETQYVLWDINNKSRKSRDLNTNPVKTVKLDNALLAEVKQTMHVPSGLLPFGNISKVPKDAKWQQVTDENIETTIPDTKVYDLIWTDKELNGWIVYKKWRGYINTETKLPRRIERWEKRTEEAEYELMTITNVAYPTTDQIRSVIKDAGFQKGVL